MISGATRGSGGGALGSHLANAEVNEAVIDGPARGLVSEDIEDRIAELTRLGSHARTQAPIYHIHADPPAGRPFTEQERADYWTRIEAELGLAGQPFASAIHVKDGREHEHRAYLRTLTDGTAIRLDHDYARREKVDRVTEYERGEPLTRGAHCRAIIAALDTERPEVAEAMRAAGLHEGPRVRPAMTPQERQQQERTRVSKDEMAAQVAQAWATSDGGTALAAALAERGLRLAQGDKRGVAVVLDEADGSHSLTRLLAAHARAAGTAPPRAAAVRSRLDGLDLPTVAEVRAAPVPVATAAPAIQTADRAPAAPDPGQPTPTPTAQADPTPASEGTTTAPAPSRDARQPAPTGVGGGGGSTATAPETGGGAALADVGDGPGEPPGPGASPDERARWLLRLAAWEERKAAAWTAWVRQWDAQHNKGGGTAPAQAGGPSHADVQQTAEATRRLLDDLRRAWERAGSAAEIRRAIARFEADSAHVRTRAAGRDDRAAGREPAPAGRDDNGHARPGRPGRGDAVRDDAAAGRGAEPDRRDAGSPDRDSGEPAAARDAPRTAIADVAADRRLERGLAAHPEALDRLRAATAALQPDPWPGLTGRTRYEAMSAARENLYARFGEQRAVAREAADALAGAVRGADRHAGRDARREAWAAIRAQGTATVAALKAHSRGPSFDEWLAAQGRTDPQARAIAQATAEQRERRAAAAARLAADRERIAAVLSTHPAPDPADRDPQARANAYAGRLSENYRDRQEAAQAAQAAALAALAARSVRTRLLAAVGWQTDGQRRAIAAVERALTLTDEEERQRPTPQHYAEARADGAAHAYAAQRATAAWEAQPEVREAREQARLTAAAEAAARDGDPRITRALRAGDPDAARAEIRRREAGERRRAQEEERRLAKEDGPGGPGVPGEGGAAAPPPGSPGPRP